MAEVIVPAVLSLAGTGYGIYANEKAQKEQQKAMQAQQGYTPSGYAGTEYPTASQMYGARSALSGGLSNYAPGSAYDTSGGGLSSAPTMTGSISNIGSEAHMGSVPGASQLLNQFKNMTPFNTWF